MLFRDRHDAGRKLAAWISKEHSRKPRKPVAGARKSLAHESRDTMVLALGRGGVPVGYELARTLNCPLDYLAVDLIPSPQNPDLVIGAIAESCPDAVIQRGITTTLGISPDEIEQAVLHAPRKERQSVRRFRGRRSLQSVSGRDCYVVNDGLCCENAAIAAARFLRTMGAKKIVFAAPIGSVKTIESMRPDYDQVICLQKVLHFSSIAFWYETFHEVSDQRVISFLEQSGPLDLSGAPRAESGNEIDISDGWLHLPGTLVVPGDAKALVLFAHGSGSSGSSPRNRHIASVLNEAGFATLLFDLLTPDEGSRRTNVYDIPLLASRLVLATRSARRWVGTEMPIAYFGVNTGAAAALWAASQLGSEIFALASRSGRPDLAAAVLPLVSSPALLIVGEDDRELFEKNKQSATRLPKCEFVALPGVDHRFDQPGALDEVAHLASRWFSNSLERVAARAA